MRIGCLQFAPKVGDVTNNIARAEAVLSSADQDELENLDLLVLPEMAFSGYNFRSQEHIAPYLEPAGAGPSSQWARTAARKYKCAVAVGYPEKVETTGQEPENYNSLIVVDRDGETLANYSKSFLYYTDATWAREGRGFYGGKLGDLGQTAMGICMDINPYKFEAPWDAYEFAFHILRVRANLVILSTAWLTNDERTGFLACPDAPDLYTLTYWAQRLEPVVRTGASEETVVVFANRSGVEDEATYAGTSTVLGIRNGQVSVYGILGRGVEELLVVDTDKPPLGRLVYRPAVPGDRSPSPPGSAPEEDTRDGRRRPPGDAGSGPGPGSGSGPRPAPGYADSPTLPPGPAPSARTQTSSLPTTARRRPTAAKAAGAEHKPAGAHPRLRTPPAASAELDPTRPVSLPLPSAIAVLVDACCTPDNAAIPQPGVPTWRRRPAAPSPPCGSAVIRVAASPSVLARWGQMVCV